MKLSNDQHRQVIEHNRRAWNKHSRDGIEWCIPVSRQIIESARHGDWDVILSPKRTVPKEWFGDLNGKQLLCLASGGGQQAPILAAAGAIVTSFDLSDEQLERDREVAKRNNLEMKFVQGDMADLSGFDAEYFDLIFHPVSNVFVPDVETVWKECFRILKPGGDLLAGFMNPVFFIFDQFEADRTGELKVKYSLPYSEPESLDDWGRNEIEESGRPLEFGHLLESQIGGQIKAGFHITGFYEDEWTGEATPLNDYCPVYIVTKATKPLSDNSDNF